MPKTIVSLFLLFFLAGIAGTPAGAQSFQSVVTTPDSSLGTYQTYYNKVNPTTAARSADAATKTTSAQNIFQETWGPLQHAGTDGSQDQQTASVSGIQPQAQEQLPANQITGMPPQVPPTGITYMAPDKAVFGNLSGDPFWSYDPPFNVNPSPNGQAGTRGQGNSGMIGRHKGVGGRSSDTSNFMDAMESVFSEAQQIASPDQTVQAAKAGGKATQQAASDASANAAEQALGSNIMSFQQSLINVANENAGTPTSSEVQTKTLSQAIWMVQQMYKSVYVPMAILLVLPGALLTNIKGMLAHGVLGQENEEDAFCPFAGIIRSMIAIFLIPATQLTVSWAIDIGNSMTYEVQNLLVPTELTQWANEQTYNPPISNQTNDLRKDNASDITSNQALEKELDPASSDDQQDIGKVDNAPEEKSMVEQQSSTTIMFQMLVNLMSMAMGIGITILLGFQVVMICYLFLLGPIAAAFFAWPSNVGSLFKAVFSNWVDAVVVLVLWRFWWCVIVLCMQTRIEWLQQSGNYLPNNQWEAMVYVAFLVMLTYVPFAPFELRPGEMVSKLLDEASQAQGASGGGGGGGGGSQAGGGSKGGASVGGGMGGMSSSGTMMASKGSRRGNSGGMQAENDSSSRGAGPPPMVMADASPAPDGPRQMASPVGAGSRPSPMQPVRPGGHHLPPVSS